MGSRGAETGERLWDSIKDKEIDMAAADHWNAYENFIPEDIHIQSPKGTFTVEGYNSILRHFLARLRRKTKCYSKSAEMLEYSVIMLMLKMNGQLSILN